MTTPSLNQRMRVQRLEEASEWLLRMQDPKRTDEQLSDWLRWIDADPQNLCEFERLQRDWFDLGALKGDESFASQHAQEIAASDQDDDLATERFSPRRLMTQPRLWAVAAVVSALALGLAWLWHGRASAPTPGQVVAATITHRAASLPDGSSMILGIRSRVNMDFNGPTRELNLSSGEAYFKVRHDKSRPFVVRAGEISVTAIGTAFDVRREHERITITVEEGTVEVSSERGKQSAVTWRAEAGYQLVYSTRDHTASLASVDPEIELGWRNGELAYIREPLGSVVENLNRYSARKIRIEDPELAGALFTGTAFASSLDDWLVGIEQAYPVSVTRTADGDIVLTKKEQRQ